MKANKILLLIAAIISAPSLGTAGDDYWQQHVDYKMEIDFDVESHQFEGKQWIRYTNNSPDTLHRAFYHLYYNAFQPGSAMDMRSQALADPDRRVQSRIGKLKPTEIGYHKIRSLKQDDSPLEYVVNGTILEVTLSAPIPPGGSTVLAMEFHSQVPIHIRRSGRDNKEGISYSMAQWYPKLCEYDEDGWHPNPYIGREFYGVWGDFEVFLTIDRDHTVAASGYLQNAGVIGHGYEKEGTTAAPARGDKHTWHFKAPNVHDFVWAADPDYVHTRYTTHDGVEMHFFYQDDPAYREAWEALPPIMEKAFDYINKNCGQYPYKTYAFIQAGDGGMEYPMATLITGNRPLSSLVGVSVHELLHSWYQMILGTNESLYSWMDEGFTSHFSALTMNELARQGLLPGRKYRKNPFASTYRSYANFSTSGVEEALTTHADHFQTNAAYGVGAYTKGNIFLNQLRYIVGEEAFARTMLRYFDEWKFKHPDADDFIRIAEKSSGMVLDWYKEYWVNSTHDIDYAIAGVSGDKGDTHIQLRREGAMPMPIEVRVTENNGDQTTFYAPLAIMRGEKPAPKDMQWEVMDDWSWTSQGYQMTIPIRLKRIARIEIDPDHQIVDVNRDNDVFIISEKRSKS